MQIIHLNRGFLTLVDDEDYDALVGLNWYVVEIGKQRLEYVARREPGVASAIYMHRQLACPPDGLHVDHINGFRLDNRRHNLRVCTQQQNNMNSSPRAGGSSRFKGVCWLKANSCWRVRIKVDQREIPLGCYDDEIEAAKAYDAGARLHHGEFARLNFPTSSA